MKEMLYAGRALIEDLASTIVFLALYVLTGSVVLAVALGIALALGQIGWQLWRRNRIGRPQWVSLFLVIASGSATLLTHNPIFVMLKPSAIYLLVGWGMMERGWMNRYMPPRAIQYVPDLGIRFGYVWAGLMFVSAALNIVLALTCSVEMWGTAMTVWGIGSKALLFLVQYAVMKSTGIRRARSSMMLA